MPPEIAALIDKPWLLVIVLAVGAVCGSGDRPAEVRDMVRKLVGRVAS